MDICYLQFYVQDAAYWRTWFITRLHFHPVAEGRNRGHHTIVLVQGGVTLLLSAPLHDDSVIARYLMRHPPGLVDIALEVADLDATMATAIAANIPMITPPQIEQDPQGCLRWGQLQGWGAIQHTVIERQGDCPCVPGLRHLRPGSTVEPKGHSGNAHFTEIDHAVINVAKGDLPSAIAWYENGFGFERQQRFTIKTQYSGLDSQVLRHPAGNALIPVNEPTSTNSQIQEFLDHNQGPGVQHVALATTNIVGTLSALRACQLEFLAVPPSYYSQLPHRAGFVAQAMDWQGIAAQQVLVDWPPTLPQAMLLQTFTQPIFDEPTFFFEIIERCQYQANGQLCNAQGFGEGNFQALFEAMEGEQRKRESLRMKNLTGPSTVKPAAH